MSKYISLVFLILVLSVLLVLPVSAEENKCEGCTFGIFSGSPACLSGSGLHICPHNFPDDFFRFYMQTAFDANNDSVMDPVPENFDTMWLNDFGITSLKGIEFFPMLRTLNCVANEITELDLRKNTNLQTVFCSNNPIVNLYISNCSQLIELDCSYTNLDKLNLKGLHNLEILRCNNASLRSLNVSSCRNLQQLYCQGNHLTELDLSKNEKFALGSADGQYMLIPLMVKSDSTKDRYAIDMSKFVGVENTANIQKLVHRFENLHRQVSYDPDTGIAKIPQLNDTYLYRYNVPLSPSCHRVSPFTLTMEFNVFCAHCGGSMQNCSVCSPDANKPPVNPYDEYIEFAVSENSDYSAALGMDKETLASFVLDGDELIRIEEKWHCDITLTIQDVTHKASEEDKDQVSSVFRLRAGEELIIYDTLFLDFSLTKQFEEESERPAPYIGNHLSFHVQIPKEPEGDQRMEIIELKDDGAQRLHVYREPEGILFRPQAGARYCVVYYDYVKESPMPFIIESAVIMVSMLLLAAITGAIVRRIYYKIPRQRRIK